MLVARWVAGDRHPRSPPFRRM